MTDEQRQELLRAWQARLQAKKYFCALNADWDWHVAVGKICGADQGLWQQLIAPSFHPSHLPGEAARRAALAERAIAVAGAEVDPGDAENAATVYLYDNPDATDEEVLDHVRHLASDAGLRPPAEAVERGRVALAVEAVVNATLATPALRLRDEHLRGIAAGIEGDEIEQLRAAFFADPLQGAEAPVMRTLGEALALARDHFVLREGIEAFEERRDELLRRWHRELLRRL